MPQEDTLPQTGATIPNTGTEPLKTGSQSLKPFQKKEENKHGITLTISGEIPTAIGEPFKVEEELDWNTKTDDGTFRQNATVLINEIIRRKREHFNKQDK